jgi:predicted anti-sigma-YlaC factor YlaD
VDCDKVQKKLAAYVDRELPASITADIEQHLRRCGDCRVESDRLQRLTVVIREDTLPAAPSELAARIIALGQHHLAEQSGHRHRFPLPKIVWWETLPGYMRAAAALVLILGLTAGTLMGLSVNRSSEVAATPISSSASDPVSVLNLDYFSETPAGSLTQVYLSLSDPQASGGR